MALALSQPGITTATMASSYWSNPHTSPYTTSGNAGGILSSTAYSVSSVHNAGSNASAVYNAAQDPQNSYSESSSPSQSQPQEQISFCPSQSQTHLAQAHVQGHRTSSGMGVGMRYSSSSSPPLTSSLQYALRPLMQQQSSLGAQNSGTESTASASSSLTPSLALSTLSNNPSHVSNPSSSLSPLSPHPHYYAQMQQTQTQRKTTVYSRDRHVHSHAYSVSGLGSGSPHQFSSTGTDSTVIADPTGSGMTANLGVQAHPGQVLYSFDPSEQSSFEHDYGYTPSQLHAPSRASVHSFSVSDTCTVPGPSTPGRSTAHAAPLRLHIQTNTTDTRSDYAGGYLTRHPRNRSSSALVYAHTPNHTTRAAASSQHHYAPQTHEYHTRTRSGTGPGARVKTEPDLEESPSLERSPDLSTANAVEGGGARFVMEHPYPYTYATTPRNAKEWGNRRSASPSSPSSPGHEFDPAEHPGVSTSSLLPASEASSSQHPLHNLDQQTPQPHSLTAPLRAVNASAAMRACMGVFRLDPFAQLNGVALRCGFVSEEAALPGRRNKNKKKAKGKGRKRSGKKNRRHSESEDEEDVLSELTDEENDVECLDDNTPTWSGLPAGPLLEKPVLIEFQLYFDGMEPEGDSEGEDLKTASRETISAGKSDEDECEAGRLPDDDDVTRRYGRSRAYSYSTAVVGTANPATARGHEGCKGEAHGSRTGNSAQDDRDVGNATYSNNAMYDSRRGYDTEHQSEDNKVQTQGRQPRLRMGAVFDEYLDIDLDDMDVDVDEWASGALSPTTRYSLSQSQGGGDPFDTFVETRTPTLRTGPTPTRQVALSSSSTPNQNTEYSTVTGPVRARYIDSAGYARESDSMDMPCSSFAHSSESSAPTSVSADQSNGMASSSSPSPFYGLSASDSGAGTGNGNGNASLQQLRTQAALRAVSAHAAQAQSQTILGLHRGVSENASGNTNRSGTGSDTVNFPTPASVAAEMQAGTLLSGRTGSTQHHHHQQTRGHASSLTFSGSHTPQEQEQTLYDGYSQSRPGNSNSQSMSHSSSYSPSGYGYTDIINSGGPNTGSGTFGHSYEGSHTVSGLERRWSDVPQRVHG